MKSLYFFSGFDKDRGFTTEIAESLQLHINNKNSLLFIASCPHDHEKTDLYKDGITMWFRNIGIEFENVDVLDNRKIEVECLELINNATVIFLMGGTTFLQFDFLQKNNLISALKQFDGIIMGLSAGAINMAVNSFYSADKDCGKTHIYKGIGLADISIEPHFMIENKELLDNDILPFSDIIDIYAMCDDSAILVRNDNCQFFGNIYLASKGKIEKVKQTV